MKWKNQLKRGGYKIGRDSNVDMMCVGMPVSFNAAFNRSAGLVTSMITFPTLHFNGHVGTITPPHLAPGQEGPTPRMAKRLPSGRFGLLLFS